MRTRLLGEGHPSIGTIQLALARLHRDEGDYEAADRWYQAAQQLYAAPAARSAGRLEAVCRERAELYLRWGRIQDIPACPVPGGTPGAPEALVLQGRTS